MSAKTLDVGPWKKGLVETISPWDIPDNSLQELLNFDVIDDGLLRCRRGFKRAIDTNNWLDDTGAIVNNRPQQVSIWGDYEGLNAGRYIFASSAGAVNGSKWLYTADPTAGWTELSDAPPAGEVYGSSVIYQNNVYVVATTYSGVGFGAGRMFNKSGIGGNPLTISAANLPKGEEAFVIKDRMFVVSYDESKIYWSKATDPVTWAAPDGGFVLVNPNDGSSGIMSCVLSKDILYVFKETGIWQFSFTADPALDGLLYKITKLGGHGASDGENIYFANANGCYQLINSVPNLLSEEVDWRRSLTGTIFMRSRDYRLIVLSGQIFVLFGNGQEGFCLNTRTGSWSRYLFGTGTQIMKGGRNTRWCRSGGGTVYYITANFFDTQLYYFRDDWKSPRDYLNDKTIRIPRYRLVTKYLTLGERVTWKRLKATWIDAYIDSPASSGGVNTLLGANFNVGFSNETRLQTNEPTPGAVSDRWFKIGNQRFLSLAFTLDSSSGASYVPASGTKDDLTTLFPYWFIRKFATETTSRELQAT